MIIQMNETDGAKTRTLCFQKLCDVARNSCRPTGWYAEGRRFPLCGNHSHSPNGALSEKS